MSVPALNPAFSPAPPTATVPMRGAITVRP